VGLMGGRQSPVRVIDRGDLVRKEAENSRQMARPPLSCRPPRCGAPPLTDRPAPSSAGPASSDCQSRQCVAGDQAARLFLLSSALLYHWLVTSRHDPAQRVVARHHGHAGIPYWSVIGTCRVNTAALGSASNSPDVYDLDSPEPDLRSSTPPVVLMRPADNQRRRCAA